MKVFLRKIRSNQLANKLVRQVLKKLQVFLDEATNHWAPSGIIDLRFNEIKYSSYTEADDYVASCLYYGKPILERQDLSAFLCFAKHSDVILDIGANVGIYSILSGKVNPQAFIYAFEPNEININRLKKNIELNGLQNIQVIERAVGNKPGPIQFTVPVGNTISDSSSALEGFSEQTYGGNIEWKVVTTEQITVDGFMRSAGLDGVDLIKIDVEGYEMKVFEGARESIRKYQPVIQCEIFVDEERKQYFDAFMQGLSYTAYMLLNEGLLRLDSGIQWQSGHNFIFMPVALPDILTPPEKAIEFIYKRQFSKQ